MAQVLVDEKNLKDIADSIRSKTNSEETYNPSEMAIEIGNISTDIDEINDGHLIILPFYNGVQQNNFIYMDNNGRIGNAINGKFDGVVKEIVSEDYAQIWVPQLYAYFITSGFGYNSTNGWYHSNVYISGTYNWAYIEIRTYKTLNLMVNYRQSQFYSTMFENFGEISYIDQYLSTSSEPDNNCWISLEGQHDIRGFKVTTVPPGVHRLYFKFLCQKDNPNGSGYNNFYFKTDIDEYDELNRFVVASRTYDYKVFKSELNMTWGDWCSSDYNTEHYKIKLSGDGTIWYIRTFDNKCINGVTGTYNEVYNTTITQAGYYSLATDSNVALRNIRVGDDLSDEIIYFQIPENGFNEIAAKSMGSYDYSDTVISCGNNNYFEEYYWWSRFSRGGGLTLYGNGQSNTDIYEKTVEQYGSEDPETTVSYTNLTSIRLPNSFGSVISINNDSAMYQYIFIYGAN